MTMISNDQVMREAAENNPELWDYSIDRQNTEQMKEIISIIGWPSISKVGEETAHSAWLLVQHADHDVAFQEYCLQLMKAESSADVAPRDIAYLEDRILINKNQPQLYGTQWGSENGGLYVRKEMLGSRQEVEQRRKAIGIGTLADNLREMKEKYKEFISNEDEFENKNKKITS